MPKTQSSKPLSPKRNGSPDKLDLRDRPYMPAVAVAPPPTLKLRTTLPVLTHFKPDLVRLHLIGHSAGSIVHSFLIKQLAHLGWRFESVNYAAAVTVETFRDIAMNLVRDGTVKSLRSFHLTVKPNRRNQLELLGFRPVEGSSEER